MTDSTKTTAVIGASPNTERYSFLATKMLHGYNHPTLPLGKRGGEIDGQAIITDWPKEISELHTVTLYVGPQHQEDVMDYVLSLQPKRVIFNPGTENPVFKQKVEAAGIEAVEACTLVMLRTEQF